MTATLDRPALTGGATIRLSDATAAGADTAVLGEDWSLPADPAIVIPAGETTGSAFVTILDDNVDEWTQTFDLEGAVAAPSSLTDTLTVAIEDNDPRAAVSFGRDPAALLEGTGGAGAVLTVPVLLDRPHEKGGAAGLGVVYTISGTAARGEDYTIAPAAETSTAGQARVSIPPGATRVDLAITLVRDTEIEDDETIALDLHAVDAELQVLQGAKTSARTSILDDDVESSPAFASDAAVPDQFWWKDRANAPLTLPAASGGNGALTYTLTPALPAGLTFDAAANPPTVTGTPTASLAAAAFTYTVTDSDPTSPDSASLGFEITVGAAPTGLALSAAATVDEDADLLTVTAEIDQPARTGGVTVTFAEAATPGTAALDTDWALPLPAAVAIAAGETEAEAEIAIIGDRRDEDDETVVLTASAATPALTAPDLTVTIVDDDTRAVLASTAALVVDEEDSAGASYAVTLDSQPIGTVTVAVGGATGEVSVSPDSLEFTPADWHVAQEVTVTAAADADAADDAATLTHTPTGGGYTGVAGPQVQVTVADDDRATAFAMGASVPEQTWTVADSVALQLPAATGGSAPLTYTLTPDITAYGLSFDAAARTVGGSPDRALERTAFTWKATDADANETSLTFHVTIYRPTFGTERLGNLSVSPGPLIPLCDPRDGSCPVGFDPERTSYTAPPTMSETVTVSFLGPKTGDAVRQIVSFARCTPGTSYSQICSNHVSITNATGVYSQTARLGRGRNEIEVRIREEGAESATTYSIDVTRIGRVELTAEPASVEEGDGAARIKVTARYPYQAAARLDRSTIVLKDATLPYPVTVPVTVGGGGSAPAAGGGVDFDDVAGFTLVIPAGGNRDAATFDLAVAGDALDEDDETLEITGGEGVAPAELTIFDDDDPPTVSISSDDAAVTEGDDPAVSATVRLDAPSGRTVTVDWATSDGSAKAGSDYTAGSGTLTFAPGETTKTVSVPILDDEVAYEGHRETFAIGLSLPTGANAMLHDTDRTVTVTVTDDDGVGAALTLSAPGEMWEGGTASVTATLSHPAPPQGLDVTLYEPTAGRGDAVRDSDWSLPAAVIAIAGGETSGAAALTIIDDDIDEPRESIVLRATTSGLVPGLDLFAPDLTISLFDDDRAPDLLVVSAKPGERPADVDEGDSGPGAEFEYKLSLTRASEKEVLVTWEALGTASAGEDYSAAPPAGQFAFPRGRKDFTIVLTVIPDTDFEEDETIGIRVLSATNTLGVQEPAETALSAIRNDDTNSTPSFAVDAHIADQVWATSVDIGTLELPVAVGGGDGGLTYTLTPDIAEYGLTFDAAADPPSITGVPDKELDGVEFRYTVTDANNDARSLVFDVVIGEPSFIFLTPSIYRVSEDAGSATVQVRITPAPDRSVDYELTFTDGTATGAADYERGGDGHHVHHPQRGSQQPVRQAHRRRHRRGGRDLHGGDRHRCRHLARAQGAGRYPQRGHLDDRRRRRCPDGDRPVRGHAGAGRERRADRGLGDRHRHRRHDL